MRYDVKVWIDGALSVTVEAEDEDDAVDRAIDDLVARAGGVFGNASFEAVAVND